MDRYRLFFTCRSTGKTFWIPVITNSYHEADTKAKEYADEHDCIYVCCRLDVADELSTEYVIL